VGGRDLCPSIFEGIQQFSQLFFGGVGHVVASINFALHCGQVLLLELLHSGFEFDASFLHMCVCVLMYARIYIHTL